MSENPIVKVTKLEVRPDKTFGPVANLGAANIEQLCIQMMATDLLQRMASRAKEIFLLEWVGGKIPRGAVVSGKTIAWTQHGMVTSDASENIGVYERIVECGGESGQVQNMIVFLN